MGFIRDTKKWLLSIQRDSVRDLQDHPPYVLAALDVAVGGSWPWGNVRGSSNGALFSGSIIQL